MKYFAQPAPAPTVRIKNMQYAAMGLAGVVTILAVAQLFTFEVFSEQLQTGLFSGSPLLGALLVPLVVVCEVFFLPFLLRMNISPAFRVFSMLLGWSAALTWLGIAIGALFYSGGASSIMMLGDVASVPAGSPGLVAAALFAIATGFVSYGIWPFPLVDAPRGATALRSASLKKKAEHDK